jgi:hypothetical protein
MSMSSARMDRGPLRRTYPCSEEAEQLIATNPSQYPISLDIPTKHCALAHPKTTGRLTPNAKSLSE